MNLAEKIDKDLIGALKNKDEIKLNTLRFLKAAIKNFAIEKKERELNDQDIVQVIRRQIKQHRDSIEAYKTAGRMDLVEKESKESEILTSYMPEELSEEKLKEIILRCIDEAGAVKLKEMGKVMSAVMARVAGRAEGKSVSKLVSEALKKMEEKAD